MSDRETILNPFQEREPSPNRWPVRAGRRRWPIFLLLLLALLAILPNLIGWTGLHQTVINYATADFDGRVTVEKASLGWLQPLVLSNVAAVDADGNNLFTLERVATTKSLMSFVNTKDLGELNIVNPTVYLHLRSDGSNFEDALAKYIPISPTADPQPENSTQQNRTAAIPGLTIRVNNGRVLITTANDTQSWQLDGLNVVATTGSDSAPLIIESECQITPMRIDSNGELVLQSPGSLAVNTRVDAGAEVLNFSSVNLALSSQSFPLSMVAPILQRFVGPAQSTGQFSGSLQSQISVNDQSVQLEIGDARLTDFVLAAPQVLGPDRIAIQNLVAQGSLQLSPTTIASSRFDVTSDFGRVNANGRFDIEQLNQAANSGQLLESPFQLDGEIDLAGLFQMLPATLQLHEDLQIESGIVRFQAGTKSDDGVPRLIVNMDTANLKARRGDQSIVWQKPLRLTGTLAHSSDGLILEDALCESDFLTVAGHASPRTGAFRAKGDLSQLMDRISQFVDLQGTQLAGELDGSLGWQTAETTGPDQNELPIQFGGRFVITDPVVQFAGMQTWEETRVQISMSATGRSKFGPQASVAVNRGGVQLDIGTEQLVATLARPINDFMVDPLMLDCELSGNLGGWVRQVQGFVDIGEVRAAGDLRLNCGMSIEGNRIQLRNLEYKVEQLAFDGYGMKLDDPEVNGKATVATYDLVAGVLDIPDTSLVAQSLAARGQNLQVLISEQVLFNGAVAYQADINRVARWMELSPEEDSVFWFGTAEGNIQFRSQDRMINALVETTIKDLVAAQRVPQSSAAGSTQASAATQWQQIFTEPAIRINSDLNLAEDFDQVEFKRLVVNSSAFSLNAIGSIARLSTSMLTDLQGSYNPDWNKINALLAAYTSNAVQLAGSGEQAFAVRGPLFPPSDSMTNAPWVPAELEATASIGWDQGQLARVPFGPSKFDLALNNGIANVNSNGIAFSGGTLNLTPTVDLRTATPLLRMKQTRIVDQVALSPETARQWLKYVAPLVADATSAQGTITIDADQVTVPLTNPYNTEATAKVQLTNVVVGAGPLADQLLSTVTQLKSMLKPEAGNGRDLSTWLQMAEQTIPIQVKNQRVFHDQLTFRSRDLVVRTSGSVGFDQSLQMVAQIPIADDWIAGKQYLAGLKGQSVSIPIRGTVTSPKLDLQSIQNLSTQLVKQAAGNAINQAIGEKVSPQVDQFQNQFNQKVNEELNRFQNKLNQKIGGALLPQGTSPAPTNNVSQPQSKLGEQLEAELKKGIGSLFGGGK
jgi:translocation and assembly module TamB